MTSLLARDQALAVQKPGLIALIETERARPLPCPPADEEHRLLRSTTYVFNFTQPMRKSAHWSKAQNSLRSTPLCKPAKYASVAASFGFGDARARSSISNFFGNYFS